MILVIDNYDSFTYNLVQYLGELGAQPFVRRNNEITLERDCRAEARADRHLAGSRTAGAGRHYPRRHQDVRSDDTAARASASAIRRSAWRSAASVVRAKAPMHGKTSTISHDGKGVFAGIASPLDGRALSLACRGPGRLAGRSGDSRADRRRRHRHGAASPRRSRFTACSSTPNRS